VALLEGSFAIYPKTTIEYDVLVTNSEISYVPSSKKSSAHVIKLSDVIGADCMRGKTTNGHAAYLNIYAYPHRKKLLSSGCIRQRLCITFVFAKFPSFEENHKDAQQWQLVIAYLVRRIEVKPEGNLTPVLMCFCGSLKSVLARVDHWCRNISQWHGPSRPTLVAPYRIQQ